MLNPDSSKITNKRIQLLEMHMFKINVKSRSLLVKAILIIILVLIILFHAIHALTLDLIVVYEDISFTSKNIPQELDGYVIAFITDTHVQFRKRLSDVVAELNQRQIDLILLGGDFTYDHDDLEKTMDLISQLKTVDGIYGIAGNHDHQETLLPAFQKHNITPLVNSGLYIHEGFYLAGVEDLWKGKPDISSAIKGANDDSFILLLAHNPDTSMKQDTTGVDYILCGHTHGGQFNLFGFLSIGLDTGVISHYGNRFHGGWALSQDGTPVYVSRGLGEYYPRVFARPEVTLITLVRE